MTQDAASPVIVKVGGSLLDLPDLGQRLQGWLDHLGAAAVLLVPGGGAAADVVRDLDRQHGLGEETAHWLAIRAVAFNAHLLQALLPCAAVIHQPEERDAAQARGCVPILDVHSFLSADTCQRGSLPCSWDVTSDSIAVRVAIVAGARRLMLLKSTAVPEGIDWNEAARRGYVDAFFPEALRGKPAGLSVTAVNLRLWTPPLSATRSADERAER